MMRTLLWAALLMSAPFGLAACGFRTKLTLGPGDPTVGIELFANDTLEPDLERTLHIEMSRAVQEFLAADLVRPSEADLILRGRITDWNTRGGVRDRDNQMREQGLTVRLEGSLIDRRSGDLRAGPITEVVQVGFLLEELDARRTGSARALANLAEALVLDLASQATRDEIEGPPQSPGDPHAGHEHGPLGGR